MTTTRAAAPAAPVVGGAFDVHALREREFPWTLEGGGAYLNAASTGPLPRRTVDELSRWAEARATPHRLSDETLFGTLARSRELIARLIGARETEVALATNTTWGLNLAALALPLGPGDVVLTPDREFPANVYPWAAAAASRGFEYRRLPAAGGVVDEDALYAAMADPAVRCVSVSWVGFASGHRLDLERLGRSCRDRGIFLVVDAIQGLVPLTLDLSTIHVDILACGAQKWLLSPWGSGFVYVREELATTLPPPVVSWMSARGTDDFRKLTEYDFTWRDDARRYEFVTLPFQDFAGMNASLELIHELGPAAVASHVTGLAELMVEGARDAGVELVTPLESARRAGIVCLRPRDAKDVSARLRAKGVVHSYREGAIRFAPHIYNTPDEVRSAVAIVRG